MPTGAELNFSDLSESPPDGEISWIDLGNVDLGKLTDLQRNWRQDGAVVLSDVVPEAQLNAWR